MVNTAVDSSHRSCVQKAWQITLLRDDVVDEVPMFRLWVHPGVLEDSLVFKVGIGNDQQVFCADK